MDNKSYSLAEVLDPSRITSLSFQCEPALEDLEVRRLFERMEMRPSDVKTLDAYLKVLDELIHSVPKDEDNVMTSSFILLDSLGPLMQKNNVKKLNTQDSRFKGDK